MRLLCLLGLMASLVSPARSQAAGSCQTGTFQATLATPHIEASLFNTGSLFFGGTTTSGDGYLVPRADSLSTIFAASLWLGGNVGGERRVAAARYGGYDFWPGPLEDAARPPDDCSAYDRIYVVSRDDLQRYYDTGELAADLRDWPHQLGAPVRDGDGVEGNYDLRAGDQPELIGDVAAWWVMNDAGADHNPGLPLGVEVRVLGFAFEDAADRGLSETTFYCYEIFNRGRQPVAPMYASMFVDLELGEFGDDLIGSDTLRHMAFVYNKTNSDSQYGSPPPAWGVQVLGGPIGLANGRDDDSDGIVDEARERIRATAASAFDVGPDGTQDPGTPEEYYFYMQGLWGNGTPYYEFGRGFEQAGYPTTAFMLPGDPVTGSFWSEVNVYADGTQGPISDRRMAISTGPFELASDSSVTLVYAMPFARGSDHLQSVARLQDLADDLAQRYTANAFAPRRVTASEWAGYRQPETEPSITLTRVHPNPARRQPEAVLTLPVAAHVRAVVYDALGREVASLADDVLRAGENRLTVPVELAPGAYVLRVEVGRSGFDALSFTVVR